MAQYPTPPLLWTALEDDDGHRLVPVVAQVAAGSSLFSLVKSGSLPVPLTRKQCHELLRYTGYGTLTAAIRAVQFRDLSDDRRLLSTWLKSWIGSAVRDPGEERLHLGFVRWCARVGVTDQEQFGFLLGYVRHRWDEDHNFEIKTRSLGAMMRATEEWHDQLTLEEGEGDYPEFFTPSGFTGFASLASSDSSGAHGKRLWEVREILSARDLLQEGARQRHCVYSYGSEIAKGLSSIWSLTADDGPGPRRTLTIEVLNKTRIVAQIRGIANRPARSYERAVVREWARNNGLTIEGDA